MLLFILALLLGAVSTVSGAAFYPARQLTNYTLTETACTSPQTVISVITSTVTVTSAASLITVAVENSASIASSLSRVASIDTVEVSDSSELRPVSAPPATGTPVFPHSIVVPVFTASEVSQGNSSAYYVSVGPKTTEWNYTPTGSITVGTTYVTVAPLQSAPPSSNTTSPSDATLTIHSTRTETSTVIRSGFTSPPYGWNTTGSASSLIGATGATGATGVTGISIISETFTESEVVATATVNTTLGFPTFHYGPPSPLTTSTHGNATVTTNSLGKRQTCTLVSAPFANGQWGTWCNIWNGESAVPQTTYETTVTPTPTPTLSSASAESSPSTVEVTLTQPSSTITEIIASVSSTSSAAAATASCGQSGPFTITFDELPVFATSDNNTDQFPPINRAKQFYDHFEFTDCWAYVPPPNEPFPPQAGDHLAECVITSANASTGVQGDPTLPDGSFGAGPRANDNNYWFDANSAWVGCNNNATDPSITCDFVATGYQWDNQSQREIVLPPQHFTLPPCPNFKNCQLQQIFFGSQFTALSSLNFYANVQGNLENWFIDTLAMSWWNNTCAAGLNRVGSV